MIILNSLRTVFDRDTVLHLRLPFSVFLLPVFMFALYQTPDLDFYHTLLVFLILHFFIYPASNVYNSYMDRDSGSIGGLENPPPVTEKLFKASVMLDAAGIMLAFLINIQAPFYFLVYSIVSRAYSWRGIRLKKYAILSWFTVSLFQGSYTYFIASYLSAGISLSNWFTSVNIAGTIISFFLVAGVYPLTQVYQHAEDKLRNDKTISLLLGVRQTFLFSAVCFIIAFSTIVVHLLDSGQVTSLFIIMLALMPVMIYFIWWWIMCFKNPSYASFRYAMRFHYLSAPSLIIAFSICMLLS